MKIAVLAGGSGTERTVSLCSGARVANALRKNGHRVLLLDLCRGIPELPVDPEELFTRTLAPEPDAKRIFGEAAIFPRFTPIGENVAELCKLAEVTFLALHGGIGEDGTLQAFLDCNGIRYTGSGATGSMLAMEKDLSKRIFRSVGIPTPEWALYDAEKQVFVNSGEKIVFPCVVKPANGGSSVGVSFANNEAEFSKALQNAGELCRYLLVERRIYGRELTIGVLGERVLPPVEILPPDGVYDFQNKYNGKTREICPADVSEPVFRKLADYARRAFEVLRLRDYARFDFLLDERESLWLLEGNSLPGMTPTSLFPKEAETVGISYEALCELLVQMAVKRGVSGA